MKSRATKIFNLLALLLGIGLLLLFLLKMDLHQVGEHLVRVGWYFAAAFVAYLAGILGGATAWWYIVDPDESTAKYWHFVAALWAGSTLNSLTPGRSLGEVLKATLMKEKIPSQELISSLIMLNFLNPLVAQLFTMIGPLVCLLLLDLPSMVLLGLFGLATLYGIPVLLFYVLLRIGAAERAIRFLAKLPLIKFKNTEALIEKARAIDIHINEMPKKRPVRFFKSILCLCFIRVAHISEVWILLMALLPDKGAGWLLLLAIVTQTAAQLISSFLTFIPAQIGVAEGGSALLFHLLGLDPVVGFSMELVRRIRKVLGNVFGLIVGWLANRSMRSDPKQESDTQGSSVAPDSPDAAREG